MADPNLPASLEAPIEQWRSSLRRQPGGPEADRVRLEQQLRAEIAELMRVGLAADEAWLIAVKRVGSRDPRTGEYAREQAERVWQPVGAVPVEPAGRRARARTEAIVAFSLAVLAGALVKVPALFGLDIDRDENVYVRNAGLYALPCLIGFFAWKRRLAAGTVRWLAAALIVAAVVANLPGMSATREFAALTGLHLPIALLLALGVAYAGGRWGEVAGRMDFIRFSGELFIYYVLIALGGGVLCAFLALTFNSIGINPGPFFGLWLVPCGAAGAVVVAAWLVETRQGVMENMAPMLTRLFTPLFAMMLVAFLVAMLVSGRGIDIKREQLIGFDLLLVVVLGLLLYSTSARNPSAPPGVFDGLQVVLVVAALLADLVALWAIGARIGEFGFSPNRVAALGENVLLLINLAGSAVLYGRFLLGRGTFASLERWQTGYLPVFAAWGAIVVIVFPLLWRWIG
ncbi:MAG: hypothetical protein HZA93_26970 [Verrucomicrobia bacterium]|nr:hypothetical protein [Verrucomicrobiota bacterium]